MSEGQASTAGTVYCPVCWGAGQLFVPPVEDRAATSCSCCTTTVGDLKATPCTRCTGTGLVPAQSPPS